MDRLIKFFKIVFLISLFFVSKQVYSQELKLIKNYYKESKQLKETYFINDKLEKNGLYISYFKNRNYISTDSNNIQETGRYLNNKKIGVWVKNTRDRADIVQEQFDFDNNIKMPVKVYVLLKYPPLEQEKEIQGVVTLSYVQNKDCSFSNIEVIKSLSPSCDMESMRALKRTLELQQKYDNQCAEGTLTKDFTFKLD